MKNSTMEANVITTTAMEIVILSYEFLIELA
jgi:hypothetical protein